MEYDDLTFNSYDDIIDLVIKKEEQIVENFNLFCKHTDKPALSKMIFPLIEQEKEHIKRLDELLHAGNLDSLFRIQKPFHIKKEDLNNTTVFEVNMRHLSFLSYGILEKEILIKLYSRLMSLTSNQDVGFLFKRLADDEKKQKSILTNHYELEMLSQEG